MCKISPQASAVALCIFFTSGHFFELSEKIGFLLGWQPSWRKPFKVPAFVQPPQNTRNSGCFQMQHTISPRKAEVRNTHSGGEGIPHTTAEFVVRRLGGLGGVCIDTQGQQGQHEYGHANILATWECRHPHHHLTKRCHAAKVLSARGGFLHLQSTFIVAPIAATKGGG